MTFSLGRTPVDRLGAFAFLFSEVSGTLKSPVLSGLHVGLRGHSVRVNTGLIRVLFVPIEIRQVMGPVVAAPGVYGRGP